MLVLNFIEIRGKFTCESGIDDYLCRPFFKKLIFYIENDTDGNTVKCS